MIVVTTWTAADCRALRTALGLQQADLARLMTVHKRSVTRWENGGIIGKVAQAGLSTMLARFTPAENAAFRQARGDHDNTDASGDTEAIAYRAGRPDAHAVAAVRSTLWAAMELDDQLGSPAALGIVTAQQRLTGAMLRSCASELRPTLLSLYAEWHGLAGVLAADAGDHAAAGELYEQGYELAHDAEDDDLAAYLLCHMSQLAIWQNRRRIASDHAVAARSWVSQSEDRRLRAYVAIRMADAAALNGHRSAALSALDDAALALDGLSPSCHPSQSRAYFTGPGLLTSYQGDVLTKLGDAAGGEAASRRAVDQIAPRFIRDRAVTMLERSRPLVRLGEIDEAAAVIGAAAELTEQNRSPRLAEAVVDARRELSPWAATPAVRDLDEELVARDIVTK